MRHHMTENGPIQFTPEEEIEWDAREAQAAIDAAKVRVPTVLTARQAKLVLNQANLLDSVNAAVAAADRATQIEWEYATEIKRDWPTLTAMATVLGMTETQLDDLFIAGAAL